MKATTLKQIAKELNLSVGTISKALKDYPDISKKTKKLVQDLAKKLNYIPNSNAVNLRTHHTKSIGVIIPSLVHYFFSTVVDGILKEAEKQGYLVILMQSGESFELEKKQIDLLIMKGVDGVLISLSNETNNFSHLKKINDYNIPLLLFDKISRVFNCSKVRIDDTKAAYDAVTYLINKGYKKIAHFRGGLNPQNSIDRCLGYRKALLDNNITYDSSLVYICKNSSDFEDGYNTAEKLLDEHSDSVDAIFAVTDVIAIGALKYFSDHKIEVPKNVAVMGFSNWSMSSLITPTLSSVAQPGFEMGRKSTEILIEEIKNHNSNKPYSFQNIVLPTSLVIRNST